MNKINLLNPAFIVQLLHVVAGSAASALLYILFIKLGLSEYSYLIAIGIFLLIIILKETLFDPKYETNQPFFWQGTEDLLFYQPGIWPTVMFILYFKGGY